MRDDEDLRLGSHRVGEMKGRGEDCVRRGKGWCTGFWLGLLGRCLALSEGWEHKNRDHS